MKNAKAGAKIIINCFIIMPIPKANQENKKKYFLDVLKNRMRKYKERKAKKNAGISIKATL